VDGQSAADSNPLPVRPVHALWILPARPAPVRRCTTQGLDTGVQGMEQADAKQGHPLQDATEALNVDANTHMPSGQWMQAAIWSAMALKEGDGTQGNHLRKGPVKRGNRRGVGRARGGAREQAGGLGTLRSSTGATYGRQGYCLPSQDAPSLPSPLAHSLHQACHAHWGPGRPPSPQRPGPRQCPRRLGCRALSAPRHLCPTRWRIGPQPGPWWQAGAPATGHGQVGLLRGPRPHQSKSRTLDPEKRGCVEGAVEGGGRQRGQWRVPTT
jgi:hypothetical protein